MEHGEDAIVHTDLAARVGVAKPGIVNVDDAGQETKLEAEPHDAAIKHNDVLHLFGAKAVKRGTFAKFEKGLKSQKKKKS